MKTKIIVTLAFCFLLGGPLFGQEGYFLTPEQYLSSFEVTYQDKDGLITWSATNSCKDCPRHVYLPVTRVVKVEVFINGKNKYSLNVVEGFTSLSKKIPNLTVSKSCDVPLYKIVITTKNGKKIERVWDAKKARYVCA